MNNNARISEFLGDVPDLPNAACKNSPHPDVFYPEPGEDARIVTALAKITCHECPAKIACLRWALTHNAEGVWGGTTDKERAKIRRQWKRAA